MKIFCSGIGGIGLSAYAALQNAAGHSVSGSDRSQTPLTDDLEHQGISVYFEQDGSHVPADADLFVYSEAIPEDAPERVKAQEHGITQMSYPAALGELSKDYTVIAVCGTHGKSSSTAMAANVLIDAGVDPTIVVGTKVPQLNGRNWRWGSSKYFLLEACEYRGSFLNLHPDIILMTNVDGDHFDAFDSVEEYQKTYGDFVQKLPEDGVLITHMGDTDCRKVTESLSQKIVDADQFPLPELSVPGKHMQQNAQLVAALADHLAIESREALKGFTGTWRRFELKGEFAIRNSQFAIPVIDDYAHHPIEIAATIASAREAYPDRRLVCLFQPHMHDRLLRLYQDFLHALSEADVIVTTDVYDARPDTGQEKADIKQFTNELQTQSVYGGSIDQAEELLRSEILQKDDVLVVMGAGDVTQVAERLVE